MDLKFSLICSPSHIVDKSLIDATKIVTSFGGGMGGSNKTYYATDIDYSRKPLELVITDVSGRVFTLGYNFIVSQENVQLLKLVHNTTAHQNYREKKFKKYIVTQYSVIYTDDKYEILNEYLGHSDNRYDKREVYKVVDSTPY